MSRRAVRDQFLVSEAISCFNGVWSTLGRTDWPDTGLVVDSHIEILSGCHNWRLLLRVDTGSLQIELHPGRSEAIPRKLGIKVLHAFESRFGMDLLDDDPIDEDFVSLEMDTDLFVPLSLAVPMTKAQEAGFERNNISAHAKLRILEWQSWFASALTEVAGPTEQVPTLVIHRDPTN